MNTLLIVGHRRDWPYSIPGTKVVPARLYLSDPAYSNLPNTRVINLCRSYAYQTRGYYVAMLAEARDQFPVPSVKAIEDIESDSIIRRLAEHLDDLIASTLQNRDGIAFDLCCYFGRTDQCEYRHLAEQLFATLHIPLLRARFERGESGWRLCHVQALALRELGTNDTDAVMKALSGYLKGTVHSSGQPASRRPALAILHTPDNPVLPSNALAIEKFQEAAQALDMRAEIITLGDAQRVTEFDGLFIRDTTYIHHYTYQLAREASIAGLVVMDDPDSILKCNNKVYMTELLGRYHMPMPKSMLVQDDNADSIIATLGLPCVLKLPGGSFSIGVDRVYSKEELQSKLFDMLNTSEMILAQEYCPTEFDWRIGVLDRRPLFACKYYMAPGHWQIVNHAGCPDAEEGLAQALAISEVPDQVIHTAMQAANLIGDGFYGVDLKQRDGQCYIIEVNDNPNVDAGNEDGVLKDALYREVMGVFRKRIEARQERST
ncbi:RimK family protein [Oxalobacteraceae bacterium R-40]|uniref:RimK family protein n=1 Tax=Keguizhuia sedimenti TaxID=3064264 RepID=A0ABU1BND8_9BURK|nr:RimK family protein [Oxalobacteraceae bacterium R-40]